MKIISMIVNWYRRKRFASAIESLGFVKYNNKGNLYHGITKGSVTVHVSFIDSCSALVDAGYPPLAMITISVCHSEDHGCYWEDKTSYAYAYDAALSLLKERINEL